MILNLLVACTRPYGNKDNGKTVEIEEDHNFQIVLEGDDSVDFKWLLVALPEFIELVKAEEISDKGRVSDYVFSFMAISYGNDVIKFDYSNGKNVKKKFELNIVTSKSAKIISQ